MSTRRIRRARALPAAAVLGIVLVGCSDDEPEQPGDDEAAGSAQPSPTATGTEGSFPIDGCLVDEETVSEIAGSEVVDVIENGTSEVGYTAADGEEVTLSSVGCNFETADGAEWRAHVVVTDEDTGLQPSAQFEAGRAVATETFAGLGEEAYLLSSTTFVKVGHHYYAVRGVAEGFDDVDPDRQRDLAEAVVVAMGGENAAEG